VAAVQYTFTHKQYTEYREQNIHNNQKIMNIHNNQKNLKLIWEVRAVPRHSQWNVKVYAVDETPISGNEITRQSMYI
jgi:hypothetical protein